MWAVLHATNRLPVDAIFRMERANRSLPCRVHKPSLRGSLAGRKPVVHDSLMAQQHHLIQQPAIPELPAGGVSEPSSAPDPQLWFVDASWLNHVSKPSRLTLPCNLVCPFLRRMEDGLVDINRDGRSDIFWGSEGREDTV